MGWLFTQNVSRKDIISQLVKFEENESGVWNTLRYCTRGNVLWSVVEYTDKKIDETRKVIGCHLLERSVDKCGDRKVTSWGYKSLDESAHPFYYSCPVSYLDDVPVVLNQEWRDKVRTYHRQYNIGDRLSLIKCKIPYLDVVSIKPLIGKHKGLSYRIPRDLVSSVQSQATTK